VADAVGVALVVLVGALQMQRADAGLVTNYGGDISAQKNTITPLAVVS